jgi:hypothetical protein
MLDSFCAKKNTPKCTPNRGRVRKRPHRRPVLTLRLLISSLLLTDYAPAKGAAELETKDAALAMPRVWWLLLFDTGFEDYQLAYPNDSKLIVTDIGKSDGSNFSPHKTHNLGRSVDFRFPTRILMHERIGSSFHAEFRR